MLELFGFDFKNDDEDLCRLDDVKLRDADMLIEVSCPTGR